MEIVIFCLASMLVMGMCIVFGIRYLKPKKTETFYETVQFQREEVVFYRGVFQMETRIPLKDIRRVEFTMRKHYSRAGFDGYRGYIKITRKSTAVPFQWEFDSSLYYREFILFSSPGGVKHATDMLIEQFEPHNITCYKDKTYTDIVESNEE